MSPEKALFLPTSRICRTSSAAVMVPPALHTEDALTCQYQYACNVWVKMHYNPRCCNVLMSAHGMLHNRAGGRTNMRSAEAYYTGAFEVELCEM